MVMVATAVGASAIWLLYRAGYAETLVEVENRAVTLANLIDAVGRFDKRFSAHTHPQGSLGATLSQIEEGMLLPGPRLTRGEIIFGRREGQQIVVLRAAHGEGLREIRRVPFDGVLAQPLFRALHGERGSGELVDYAGVKVLAGYAPIPSLDLVISYKITVTEVNSPFFAAGLSAAGIAVGFIALGALVFVVLIRPLQQRMDENEQRSVKLLQENEAHLNEAQHLAQIGSWELDLVGGKLSWSDEIFRIFEIDPRKFGATYEAFLNAIHPEDREAVNHAYTQSLADRLPYRITHRLEMPDGRIKWVEERCESIFDVDGKPLRSSGTVQDVTRLKLAETELETYRAHLEELVVERTRDLETAKEAAERASHAKTEFLSRMSHELRTPMNAILGFSQVLELESLTADQYDSVREIHKAGDHLLDLINELLDLSRIEAGKLTMVIGPVGLASTVGSALQMTRGLLDQHRISVVNKCAEEVVVLADTTRLRQILVNLLSNAAKYNREGGSVRIDCQPREADLMRVSVTDTGPGIAPEHLPNLFKPFERLGAETTAVEGAGIGLALSQKLAELMGTTLGVATSLGQGSTFWLDIPRAEAATVSAAAAEALASVGQSRTRVLYVEDNPANLKVVEAMFRHHPDLLLFSAVSGEAGLELARRYLPDVILLDIHLPGMDGYAVLQALQEDPDTRAIPVIALSADAMPIDVERGLAAGFREYLTKPIQLRELMLAVDKALKEAKS